MSLPWGTTCKIVPNIRVVDVLYPAECCNTATLSPMCKQLGLTKPFQYPKRFFLNITSHVQWWAAQGVETVAVIVVRDKTISLKSRSKAHCKNPTLAKKEEDMGSKIITQAIQSLPLSRTDPNASQPLGRILLVSYETLVKLKQPYLNLIYQQLGLKASSYVPSIVDGNANYVAPGPVSAPKTIPRQIPKRVPPKRVPG